MARTKNLDTIVKAERVRVSMVPGCITLRPEGKSVVQLASGGFDAINQDGVRIEAEGDHNMGTYSQFYDLSNPQDRAIIELLEANLEKYPWWRTHADYKISIVGEYDANEPWAGYDDQDAESLEAYYRSMPDMVRAQHPLEQIMKHELSRVNEEGESLTNKDKVDVLNKLHREAQVEQKDAADGAVAL